MFNAKWISAAVAATGLMLSVNASASSLNIGDTVYVRPGEAGTRGPADLYRTMRITEDGGANWKNIGAGYLDLEYSHDKTEWTRFLAFCIELSEDLQPFDPAGYKVAGSTSAYLSELFGRYADLITTKDLAGAFQVAIWEIVSGDATLDLGAGNFQLFDGGVYTDLFDTAQGWLDSLDGTGPKAALRSLLSEDKQDLVTQIPEPGSLALLGLGLLGLGLSKRRRAN